MPAERWLPISGWPGYEVSSHGRVRSPQGVLAQWADRDGYLCVTLRNGQRRRTARVHVLVAEAFLPPKPFPGAQVRHLRRQHDNHAVWLAWGTQAENEQDKKAARRRRAGGNRNLERTETRADRGNEALRAGAGRHRAGTGPLRPGQTPVSPQDATEDATTAATGLVTGAGGR